MPVEVSFLCKPLFTQMTDVGPLSCVISHVDDQVPFVTEYLVTHSAGELLLLKIKKRPINGNYFEKNEERNDPRLGSVH